jgi:hypothetical protein
MSDRVPASSEGTVSKISNVGCENTTIQLNECPQLYEMPSRTAFHWKTHSRDCSCRLRQTSVLVVVFVPSVYVLNFIHDISFAIPVLESRGIDGASSGQRTEQRISQTCIWTQNCWRSGSANAMFRSIRSGGSSSRVIHDEGTIILKTVSQSELVSSRTRLTNCWTSGAQVR